RFMYGSHEAVRDVKVRKAISMAIDRDALASLRPESSAPGTALVPGNVVSEWDDSVVAAFDPDGARALMSEAGYDTVPPIRLQSNSESPFYNLLLDTWADVF